MYVLTLYAISLLVRDQYEWISRKHIYKNKTNKADYSYMYFYMQDYYFFFTDTGEDRCLKKIIKYENAGK